MGQSDVTRQSVNLSVCPSGSQSVSQCLKPSTKQRTVVRWSDCAASINALGGDSLS